VSAMVFLATTSEPECISHRAMALSAHSKAEGISHPVLASGVRSVAEGIFRPALASGATSTTDPRVNLPNASRFCREACADWHGSSQPCPSSRWRQNWQRRNPNWNREENGGTRLELVGTDGTRGAEEVPPIFVSTKVHFYVKKT
jgi:hypothetical protein